MDPPKFAPKLPKLSFWGCFPGLRGVHLGEAERTRNWAAECIDPVVENSQIWDAYVSDCRRLQKKPTMSQLASAHREVHVKLAEKTRAGLPLCPGGELPLDQHLDAVLALPSVMWLLMPKLKTAASEKSNSTAPTNNQPTKRPWDSPGKKGKGKGGRFDELKSKKLAKTPMPVQLRSGTPVDAEGRSICFNLGSCHDRNCKKGRHICCKPGCFSATHNFVNHDKSN